MAQAADQMSEEERRLRILCRDNLDEFAERCLKVRTKKPGPLVPLKFNRSQKFLHQKLQAQLKDTGMVRAIVVKGRQLGCSTYAAARFYHRTTHSFGTKAFILTHLQDATDNLFNMVDRYHENNNPLLKPITGKSNAKELTFPILDAGYRVGTAGSSGIGRSETIQLFHGSEVAFWHDAGDHVTGVMQAVPQAPGTEVILESTAQGLGNYFANEWSLAVSKKSQFIPVFIPWFWDPDYAIAVGKDFELSREEEEYLATYGLSPEQMAWRRNKIVELKEEWKFQQEYPATAEEAFQSSGEGSYIKPILVARARRTEVRPQAYVPIVIGVDPSGGGRDDTAIIDRQGRRAGGHVYEQIKEPDAMVIAGKIVLLIKRINPKKVIVDATEGNGDAICDRLVELGYGKIVQPVKFSHRAIDDENYANKRAEMYADLLDWLRNPLGVQIPDDDELQAEICAPIWGAGATKHNSAGQLLLEPKEHIVKRIKVSPDKADALALTFGAQILAAKPDTPAPRAAAVADRRAGY